MKTWRIVTGLLLSLVLVSAIACSGGTKSQISQQLATVTRGDLAIKVSASGNIAVAQDRKLAFGIGGRVDKIYIKENDEISKGAVLAKLETDALELALAQAKVAVTQAQVGVAESGVTVTRAEMAVAQAQAAHTQAQVAVTEAERAVTRAGIGVTQAQAAHGQAQAAYTQAQAGVTQAQVAVTRAEMAVTQAQVAVTQAQVAYTQTQAVYAQAQAGVTQAQVALQTTEEEYRVTTMLSGRDTLEVVAIKKRQVEAAQQSLEAAQQSLEAARQSQEATRQALELAKLSPEVARQSLEVTRQSLELAKLSPEVARQSLEVTRQSLEVTRQSLEVTRQSLELAKLSPGVARQSLELAKQSLEQAQKQLDKATLVAPFAGVVARLYDVNEGDTISTVTTILYLIDPSLMELKVQVDEIDIPGVKIGQRAIVKVDALPDTSLDGKVSSIAPIPTKEAGVTLFDVKIALDSTNGTGLRGGMSASSDIVITERTNVLLVPDRVVKQNSQGKTVVDVVVNGQIEERAVVIGISDGFQTEIVSGLEEGETLAQ